MKKDKLLELFCRDLMKFILADKLFIAPLSTQDIILCAYEGINQTDKVHQLHLSTTDKDDNEIIPEVVHRSPGIYLMADENPEKPQLGDCLTKAV